MADVVFKNGKVWTCEEARPRASALLVRDGSIAALGDDAEISAMAPAAKTIDLAGRALVPGFNDAHVHVWKVGHFLTSLLDLRGVRSIAEMTPLLRARAEATARDRFVLARGVNENVLEERRLPTRADLDRAAPDHPVIVVRQCGHIGIANSRALAAAGITSSTPDPTGGVIDRDSHGEPTGVVRETALTALQRCVPKPSESEYESMIAAAHRKLIEHGITSATDPGVEPELLYAYRRLDERGALAVRMNVMALGTDGVVTQALPVAYVSETLRIDTVKFFLDGGLSGGTAALGKESSYADGTRGILRLDEAAFYEPAREVQRAGLRIAAHAIGDRAVECALGVYECLRRDGPGLRHRIEHGGLATKAQLRRLERGRHPVVMQPIFVRELAASWRAHLGESFSGAPYPLRTALDSKCDLALSSDAPVVDELSPLVNIATAVTRRGTDGMIHGSAEAISIGEALRAATLGGAIASGDEHSRGSLRVGKRADVVVLDRDPLSIEPGAIESIRVDLTMVNGEIAFER